MVTVTIQVSLDVKFRMFGIDFYKFHHVWPLAISNIPAEVALVIQNAIRLHYSDHGVLLDIVAV